MSEILKLTEFLNKKDFINFQLRLDSSFRNRLISEDVYYNFLGLKFFYIRDYTEAINNFQKSININDKNPDGFLNIAICFTFLKKEVDADQNFTDALNLNPKSDAIYIHYSRSLRSFKKFDKAEKLLKQSLKSINSNNLTLIQELANFYREVQNYDLAIVYYEKMLEKSSLKHIVYNNIAVCHEHLRNYQLTEENFKKSLKLNPDYYEGMANYGNFLRSLGRSKEAIEIFEKCLNSTVQKSQVFRFISILHKFNDTNDRFLRSMLNYLKSDNFKNDDKSFELYFALSKAYEDIGDKSEFNKFLLKANKVKRECINNDDVEYEFNQFNILNLFENKTLDNYKPNIDGSKIILVLGMPRSGTTLVEQILGSHNAITAGGEQIFFQNILKNNFDFENQEKFQKEFLNSYSEIKDSIGKSYIDRLKNIDDKKIVTDKLPFNFLYIGFFLTIFKDIKIIHVKRDALDNCFSIFKNFFAENINFAYDQKELAEYYNLYENMMIVWERIFNEKIYTIHYEKLVSDKENEIKKLLNYCNLDWDKNCLEFYKSRSSVKTLSTIQVRKPIYTSSIQSSKNNKEILKTLANYLN